MKMCSLHAYCFFNNRCFINFLDLYSYLVVFLYPKKILGKFQNKVCNVPSVSNSLYIELRDSLNLQCIPFIEAFTKINK